MNNKFSFNNFSDKIVWIDLNSHHHVRFFVPIIESLVRIGFDVKISVRNNPQTVFLANLFHLKYTLVGTENWKNRILKFVDVLYSVMQLFSFACKHKPSIALFYGFRSQILLTKLFKITTVVFLDDDNVNPLVKPDLIFLPRILSTKKIGTQQTKIIAYPGVTEDLYISNFEPDKTILDDLGIKENTINILLKQPTNKIDYYSIKNEKLFEKIIEFVTKIQGTRSIILPRSNDQRKTFFEKYKNFLKTNVLIIPDDLIDEFNLIWHCDLVISGDKRINREAAALGIPVYNISKGKVSKIEKYLAKAGKIQFIEKEEDLLKKIRLIKKKNKNFPKNLNSLILQTIINEIIKLVGELTTYNSEQKIFLQPRTVSKL